MPETRISDAFLSNRLILKFYSESFPRKMTGCDREKMTAEQLF